MSISSRECDGHIKISSAYWKYAGIWICIKQSSSLGSSIQRLPRIRMRFVVGHGSVIAIRKSPLLKISSWREREMFDVQCRRSVSVGGRYTKRYLGKFEKFNKTSREQVELHKGQELSSTDELIENTDVEEAQPDWTTVVLCAITTEELDFRSTLDSEAKGSFVTIRNY